MYLEQRQSVISCLMVIEFEEKVIERQSRGIVGKGKGERAHEPYEVRS